MPDPGSPADTDLAPLLELVRRLRAPDGCPWDRRQRFGDVRAYLLEEAHEAATALDRRDLDDLAGELGDLLFQVVFLMVLGEEASAFDAAGVIRRIHAKMVERHPHVFGDEGERGSLASAEEVRDAWEVRKLRARQSDGEDDPEAASLLAGVSPSLPALLGAYRMTQKAAGVGFDWRAPEDVLAKVDEELAELRESLDRPADDEDRGAAVREEVGDLLFTVVNLARKLDLDPEAALAETNLKFRRRFARVEAGLAAEGRRLDQASLEEMEAHWAAAKMKP